MTTKHGTGPKGRKMMSSSPHDTGSRIGVKRNHLQEQAFERALGPFVDELQRLGFGRALAEVPARGRRRLLRGWIKNRQVGSAKQALSMLRKGTWRLVARKLRRPPRLRHEASIRAQMLDPYYDALNEQEAFQGALEWLFTRWSWTRAERLAAWLRLPRVAVKDLHWSYTLWYRGLLRKPKLRVGSRSYPGLENEEDEAEARRLGYRPNPPRLGDQSALRLGAVRLYRRAVLGWPWQQIARVETDEIQREEGFREVDPKTVWDQVQHWSAALGVPLPKRSRGRPRKSPPPRA